MHKGTAGKGNWIDLCDVCKKEIERSKLVYRKCAWNHPPSQNYLPYSEYDEQAWTTWGTGDIDGTLSWGMFPHKRWSLCQVNADPIITDGIPAILGALLFGSIAVDCSTWADIIFSVYIGPYEMTNNSILTVGLGLVGNSGPDYPLYLSDTMFLRRHWLHVERSELEAEGYDTSALRFWFGALPAADQRWFFERAALQRDVLTPMAADVTTGDGIVVVADTSELGVGKVCPKCKESIPNDQAVIPMRRDDLEYDRYQYLPELPEDDVDG